MVALRCRLRRRLLRRRPLRRRLPAVSSSPWSSSPSPSGRARAAAEQAAGERSGAERRHPRDAQTEQPAGRLRHLTERRQPAGQVVHRLHELAEVGRERPQHGSVQGVSEPVEAGHDPVDRTLHALGEVLGHLRRAGDLRDHQADGFLVLVEQAVHPRDGLVEVGHRRVEVLQPRIISSAPRRSWSNDRITAAIGPATSEIISANGSLRLGASAMAKR